MNTAAGGVDVGTERSITEEVEEAPGLFVSRRSLFAAVTAIVAMAIGSLPSKALAKAAEEGLLSLSEFLEHVNPLAESLVRDASLSGQDRYLLTVASYAVRLVDVPIPEMRESGQGPGALIGVNPGGDPFVVLHWRLEPGGIIRPHAHTYGNVITLGLEGEARVDNYEVVGTRDYSSNAPFTAQRTRTQLLTPGGINLVNLERDYIHGFTTGKTGARGLDITTRLRPRAPTPYLEVEKKLPGTDNLFAAHWQFDGMESA